MTARGALSYVWGAYAALPVVWQVGLAGALLVAFLAVGGGVGAWVSHYKDQRFDAAEAARNKERLAAARLVDAAIDRAEAAEARAALLEEQVAAQRAVVESKGKTAAERARAAEEIARETEAAIDAVGADAATAPERRERIRRRLRDLGYLPAE